MTEIPLLTPEQFDSLDLITTEFELLETREAMDILGQITPMLWVKAGEFEAHIPATLFRQFTLKCQQYLITPEFPLLVTDRHADFSLVKHYFEQTVKYVFCQEKIKHLLKVLFTQQEESQLEMFKVPQDFFERLELNAKEQTKKAFMTLFKQSESSETTELSFFTEMRTILKLCQAELKTTTRVAEQCAKIKELGVEAAGNEMMRSYIANVHMEWERLFVYTIPTLEITVAMLEKAEYWMDLAHELMEKQLKEGENPDLSDRIAKIEESLNMNYVLIRQYYDYERTEAITKGFALPNTASTAPTASAEEPVEATPEAEE